MIQAKVGLHPTEPFVLASGNGRIGGFSRRLRLSTGAMPGLLSECAWFHMRGSAPQPPGPRRRLPWLGNSDRAVGVTTACSSAVTYLAAPAEMAALRRCKSAGSYGAASDTLYSTHSWSLAGLRRPPAAPPQRDGPSPRRRVANPFRGEAG
jgi:hypothetical protein